MDPIDERLDQELKAEIKHDQVINRDAIIGGLVLVVIVLGGIIWYMATHQPGMAPSGGSPTATTSPVTGQQTASGNTLIISEDAPYYTVHTEYPAVTPLKASAGATADAKAVEVMKQFELNTIAAFKEQGNFTNLTPNDVHMLGFDQGAKESLDVNYSVYSGTRTISYLYKLTQDTLGAHPNTFYRSFVFDTATGEGLQLGDLFKPSVKYLSVLSAATRKALPAIIAAHEGVKTSAVDTKMLTAGTTADADNFQTWYIDGTNLVIVFPPYQVAPYSAGVQVVAIPLASLSASLK